MNWAQLGKFVADIKKRILLSKKSNEDLRLVEKKAYEDKLKLQAAQKKAEKEAAEKHEVLVKKLAKAESVKQQAELTKAIEKQAEVKREILHDFQEKKKAIERKTEQVKQEIEEKKLEDKYAPIRSQVDRLVRLLERRDEEEECKALSHKNMTPLDRQKVRNAALNKGNWLRDFIGDMFLPPLSNKDQLKDYKRRQLQGDKK